MKFCYLDESGTGAEPYAVMAGIIVDSQRMRLTKTHWADLLTELTRLTGRQIREFHTRDFYRGNGTWRAIDGPLRSRIIHAILDWIETRKHKITFCGIEKVNYNREFQINNKLQELQSLWCTLAFHQVLIIQKRHQTIKGNKGNTLFVFDREVREEANFSRLINSPPVWSDYYYGKKRTQDRIDQVIDVPYFGNSQDVHLIQVADLIAYILRLFLELENHVTQERHPGELIQVREWVTKICNNALTTSSRYPARGRDECSEVFYSIAPTQILNL